MLKIRFRKVFASVYKNNILSLYCLVSICHPKLNQQSLCKRYFFYILPRNKLYKQCFHTDIPLEGWNYCEGEAQSIFFILALCAISYQSICAHTVVS